MKKLLLILLFPLQALAQNYPAIHSDRPRIFADSSRIAWLQAHINVAGECKDTYDGFLDNYNNNWINDPQLYLLGSDSTQWTWDWSSQWAKDEAIFTVVLYRLTQDTLALKRCRFIARQFNETVAATDFASIEFYARETLLRDLSNVGSILLDWCYDDMVLQLRSEVVQSLYTVNSNLMGYYIYNGTGDSYNGGHNAYNCDLANRNTLALHQAEGLTSAQQDTVQQWYQVVYDKWINGLLPVFAYYRDDDGGWNWGGAYAYWALPDQYEFFDNMLIGTGTDFYQSQSWVQNSINQYWYMVTPDDKVLHLGDGETAVSADRVIYRHAAVYNDPRSIWLAQKYSQAPYMTWTLPLFYKLVFKNFEAPVIALPEMPKQWRSDKVGLSVSRSGWDSTAAMVTFFCSPAKRNGHEHRDNNSFTLFKHKPLLIDAGNYDAYNSVHYQNYYTRTIAHNSICVHDASETFTDMGNDVSNDGGQMESGVLQGLNDIFLTEHQRGAWKRYVASDTFTYNVADATLSYNPDKLDFFRRRFLFVPPGKIIVLDHIHITNSSLSPDDIKWVAHFVHKPDITGNIINTQVPGHIETYNGTDIKAANGAGIAVVRTLLPQNTTTTLIGGTGYEYWVNGQNFEPLTAPDTNLNVPGSWRVEISPATLPANDTVVYAHTIFIGDQPDAVESTSGVLQNPESIAVEWNDSLFIFSASGAIAQSEHTVDNVPGGRSIQLFAFDLDAGNYCILLDGTEQQQAAVDNDGYLQAALSLTPGAHTLRIVACEPSSVHEAGNDALVLNIYPNPAKSYAYIYLPHERYSGKNNYDLCLYDIGGKKFTPEFTSGGDHIIRVNLKGIPSGFYFVTVSNDKMRYTGKLSVKQ